jgi:hypothetical protein
VIAVTRTAFPERVGHREFAAGFGFVAGSATLSSGILQEFVVNLESLKFPAGPEEICLSSMALPANKGD